MHVSVCPLLRGVVVLCVLSQEEGGEIKDDYSKGVVFYLNREEKKIVGVLTWNLFGKMDLARKVRKWCIERCVLAS